MSRFFIGQRVRLVSPANPKNMGLEGRIRCFEFTGKGTIMADGVELDFDCDCVVDYGLCPTGNVENTRRLEPILPEGHQPSEFTTLHDLLASLEVTA